MTKERTETEEIFFLSGGNGRYGKEFLEIEINNAGVLRYKNASRYKKDGMIRKHLQLSRLVVDFFRDTIDASGVMTQRSMRTLENIPRKNWSSTMERNEANDSDLDDKRRKQDEEYESEDKEELDVVMDGLCFRMTTAKLKSMAHAVSLGKGEEQEKEMERYYTLLQEIQTLAISFINARYKANPFG
eukprot:snap_masked-scaffold_12-processed-gene-10.25-mRNA-1 protein AED:0.32 eAED:0.32 QI:0/0/0/1/1/1/2/0/186